MTILVCKCKRTGCLAATQVPEKGTNVYAPAFFIAWLRGLGWKRFLLRSDNERALLAFLRAAAASLEGVDKRALKGITQRMESLKLECERTDSSAEESCGRETQETAGLE